MCPLLRDTTLIFTAGIPTITVSSSSIFYIVSFPLAVSSESVSLLLFLVSPTEPVWAGEELELEDALELERLESALELNELMGGAELELALEMECDPCAERRCLECVLGSELVLELELVAEQEELAEEPGVANQRPKPESVRDNGDPACLASSNLCRNATRSHQRLISGRSKQRCGMLRSMRSRPVAKRRQVCSVRIPGYESEYLCVRRAPGSSPACGAAQNTKTGRIRQAPLVNGRWYRTAYHFGSSVASSKSLGWLHHCPAPVAKSRGSENLPHKYDPPFSHLRWRCERSPRSTEDW